MESDLENLIEHVDAGIDEINEPGTVTLSLDLWAAMRTEVKSLEENKEFYKRQFVRFKELSGCSNATQLERKHEQTYQRGYANGCKQGFENTVQKMQEALEKIAEGEGDES